jgi:hypothetical protein
MRSPDGGLQNPLLRLPAVGDNAAMRKRRWRHYGLRTLLTVITIMVVQCAVCLPMLLEWQRQRERALAENWLRNHVCSSPPILEGFRVRR